MIAQQSRMMKYLLLVRLTTFENGRLRLLSRASDAVLVAVQNQYIQIVDQPVLDKGRLGLRHYLLEQAVSETVHRYGNIAD